MECPYCKNIFTNKHNLKAHQTRVKYCLKIQEKYNTNVSKISFKLCVDCDKKFSVNNYNKHIITCKNKLQNMNNELKQQVTELQKEVEFYKTQYIDQKNCIQDIAKQPRIINTSNNTSNTTNTVNILNNITPINLDKIKAKEKIELLWNREDFNGGQKAAANFVVNNLLKDDHGELMYRCTDPSRHVFKYKNVDGHITKDVKAKKLTSLIGKHIQTKNQEIVDDIKNNMNSDTIQEMTSDNIKEINTMNIDNYNFREELSSLTS
jgi:hypothetical protein